jgi:hypothetical protein
MEFNGADSTTGCTDTQKDTLGSPPGITFALYPDETLEIRDTDEGVYVTDWLWCSSICARPDELDCKVGPWALQIFEKWNCGDTHCPLPV